jgi:hypothetical protein
MRGVNSPSRCHEKGIRVTMNAMKENAENAWFEAVITRKEDNLSRKWMSSRR